MSSYFGRSITLLAGILGANTALKIGDSRIQFSVKKTNKRSNNSAEIRIFNASKTTIATLELDKTVVTLSAGYEKGFGVGVVFSGDVADIRTERSGADIVTIIELSEGTTVINDKSVSLSMAGVVSPLDALNKLALQMGITTNITPGIPFKPYQSGFTAFGAPMNAISKICKKIKCDYSIESGVLNVWSSINGKSEAVVLFSPQSGLIGIPEKIKIDKKNGWSIKSLLNSSAMPGTMISVLSKAVTGNIKIINVQTDGDTHAGEWTTIVEGKIVS